MNNVDAFVRLCERVIADYQAGLIDLYSASEKIYTQAQGYPFEDNAHPMLYKVSDLTFDITEHYRSDADDKADWQRITTTIKRYSEGSWEPTCWLLSAMYGKYSGEALEHSYSVTVGRQNGETTIETAYDELKKELGRTIKKCDPKQTDERYLQNLAKFLPTNIKGYTLNSVEVGEYLTEPYGTTT